MTASEKKSTTLNNRTLVQYLGRSRSDNRTKLRSNEGKESAPRQVVDKWQSTRLSARIATQKQLCSQKDGKRMFTANSALATLHNGSKVKFLNDGHFKRMAS